MDSGQDSFARLGKEWRPQYLVKDKEQEASPSSDRRLSLGSVDHRCLDEQMAMSNSNDVKHAEARPVAR